MELLNNTTYRDGDGRTYTVVGETKSHPEYVWTIQGFWYERKTGKRVWYGKKNGVWTHYVLDSHHHLDLTERTNHA